MALAHVLVAGIGGASLGTELLKALRLAGSYRVSGCDVSALAFGHYDNLCERSFLITRQNYIEQLMGLCREKRVDVVVPGGDQPARLIAASAAQFASERVLVAANNDRVVALFGDKARTFAELTRLGFKTPRTIEITDDCEIAALPIPCIVKPSAESGGSTSVFFAGDRETAKMYIEHLRRNNLRPIAQEYIPHMAGEYTIGVLSGKEKNVFGSIVLRREFPSKLSVAIKGPDFLISSGYSQGYIGHDQRISSTAEAIATAVASTGPLNIQGRVNSAGDLVPFEINPRFSASTYLRALAGFNEVDFYIRHLLDLPQASPLTIRPGWYLRSLSETVVSPGELVT